MIPASSMDPVTWRHKPPLCMKREEYEYIRDSGFWTWQVILTSPMQKTIWHQNMTKRISPLGCCVSSIGSKSWCIDKWSWLVQKSLGAKAWNWCLTCNIVAGHCNDNKVKVLSQSQIDQHGFQNNGGTYSNTRKTSANQHEIISPSSGW